MARRKKSLAAQIADLVDQFAPKIKSAFLSAIGDIKDTTVLDNVVSAIEAGDPIKAYKAIGFSDAAMRPVTSMIETAFETGGVTTGGTFPKLLNTPTGQSRFIFDVRNSRAERILRDQSSKLVTRIGDDQLTAIRNVVSEGVQAGTNPRTIAKNIIGRIDPVSGRRVGGIVGLTAPGERAVAAARVDLSGDVPDERYFTRVQRDKRFDKTVRKAINDGKPLPAATVQKLTDRYSDNLLNLRGETIARTEALTALNASEYEALQQADDMGAINSAATQREWDDAADTRVRKDHQKMNGQRVGIKEPFKTPEGRLMMHPGDTSLGATGADVINCRCRTRLIIDWMQDLD